MGRMKSHILWKIKNVWNHQPGFVMICVTFQGTDGVQHSILGLEAEDGQEKTTSADRIGNVHSLLAKQKMLSFVWVYWYCWNPCTLLSNPALQQATFVDKLPLLTLWTIHKTWAKSVHSPFPGWATRESFPTWAGVDKVQCRREPGVRSSILGHSWILGFLISIFFSGTSGTFTMWLVFRTSIDIFSKM